MTQRISTLFVAFSLIAAAGCASKTEATRSTTSTTTTTTSQPAADAEGQAPQEGACLEKAALGDERFEQMREKLQSEGFTRDEAAEQALQERTGKTLECYAR